MSNEEILEDNWESGLIPNDYPGSIIITKNEIFKMMEIAAKQHSIQFFRWVWFEKKSLELSKEGWYDEYERDENMDPKYMTDDQVYNDYLKNKK